MQGSVSIHLRYLHFFEDVAELRPSENESPNTLASSSGTELENRVRAGLVEGSLETKKERKKSAKTK